MSFARHGRGGRAVLACALALATAVPRLAAAEEPAPPTVEPLDPRSVYKVHPWIDGSIIVGSNAVTAGLYLFVTPTPTCPCDPMSVNSFDRHAIGYHSDGADLAGTGLVAASVLLPVGLDLAVIGPNRVALEDSVVLAESLSVSGALVTIAKSGFQRPFPRTYAGFKVDDPNSYRSFYSGHTALAFTALSTTAMTVGRRYHSYAVPWAITVIVGSAVGVSMIWSGWHFPSDVMVGAVMGTATGVAVPALHFREPPLSPVVLRGPNGTPLVGLNLTWR